MLRLLLRCVVGLGVPLSLCSAARAPRRRLVVLGRRSLSIFVCQPFTDPSRLCARVAVPLQRGRAEPGGRVQGRAHMRMYTHTDRSTREHVPTQSTSKGRKGPAQRDGRVGLAATATNSVEAPFPLLLPLHRQWHGRATPGESATATSSPPVGTGERDGVTAEDARVQSMPSPSSSPVSGSLHTVRNTSPPPPPPFVRPPHTHRHTWQFSCRTSRHTSPLAPLSDTASLFSNSFTLSLARWRRPRRPRRHRRQRCHRRRGSAAMP